MAAREADLIPLAQRLNRTAAALAIDGGVPLDQAIAALPGALRELRGTAPTITGLVDRLDRFAVAVAPALTASDYYQGWTYEGGALSLAFIESWGLGLAEDTARRMGRDDLLDDLHMGFCNMPAIYDRLPLTEPGFLGLRDVAPYYFDWLEHDKPGEYWTSFSVAAGHARVRVPALHISGWYDAYAGGAIGNFLGLRENAATPLAREHQYLWLGPWGHYVPRSALKPSTFAVASAAREAATFSPTAIHAQVTARAAVVLRPSEARLAPTTVARAVLLPRKSGTSSSTLVRGADFRNEDDLISLPGSLEPVADHGLRLAALVAGHPARIDIRRVDRVEAAVHEAVEELRAGRLIDRPAEDVGAENERRDLQARAAEGAQVHDGIMDAGAG